MRIAIFSFVLWCWGTSMAQVPIFDKITKKEGLPENDILCMVQDNYGHLWFGGFNGLSLYNGYSFRTWRHELEDSTSLPNNHISFLTATPDHSLLVGYMHLGFFIFDYQKELFVPLDRSQKNTHKTWLTAYYAKSGVIYVGSSEGLEYYDKAQKRLKRIDLGIKEPIFISCIVEDDKGHLWMMCNSSKMAKYDPITGKTEVIAYGDNQKDLMNTGGELVWDPKGYVWIGTEYEGLYVYNLRTKTFQQFCKANKKIKSDIVLCFSQDKQNGMWVGTDNGGVYYFKSAEDQDPSHYVFDVDDESSISSNTVYGIIQIEPNLVLFGTFAGGLDLINGYRHKFKFVGDRGKPGKILSQRSVLHFFGASKGKMWVGTDGGGLDLYDIQTQDLKFYKMPHSTVARSVFVDSKSRIWVGSYAGGTAVFDSNLKHIKTFSQESKDRVSSDHGWCFAEDRQHRIWMGTLNNGVERISPDLNHVDHYTFEAADHSGLLVPRIEQMLVDKNGTLWLISETLHYFDLGANKFKEYKYPGLTLPSNLYDLCLDNEGNLWIGGGEATLCKIPIDKKKKPVLYPSTQGWVGNTVLSIQADEENNMWIATDLGITCLLTTGPKEEFLNFDMHDGVMPNQFNRGSKWRDERGNIYFGGTAGYNWFHPKEIKLNTHLPKVSISEIRVYNEPLSSLPEYKRSRAVFWNDSILHFEHDVNMISIEFAGLDFVLPEKNRYSYMLEGFDKQWSFSEKGIHMVTYTNLDPGKYAFRVKGANNDGKWNDEISQLYLVVLPPWWQTWWFRSLAAMAFVGIVMGIFYWRTKLIRERNIQLKNEVEAQTHELRNINHELGNLYAEVTESIQAAQAIQNGILPEQELLEEYFGSIEVFYRPKDVVSGDFYWCARMGGHHFLAVIDCTGHGVAGAFMTFIAYETLNQIVRENMFAEAGQMITSLNQEILRSLNQYKKGKINAGMDVSLCIWNKQTNTMQFAGANNPLYLVKEGKVQVYKGDRQGVGGKQLSSDYSFSTHHLVLEKKDQVYLFSDGYADQIGGPDGHSKYMYPRFRETLAHMHLLPLRARLEELEKGFDEWKGEGEQLDDVLVIGFEVG
jgi:ligand-binding sensor domain-containing protein/serine phosphatase RsbU (regulator of sigma subunit)